MRNSNYRYFLYARKSSESEDRQMASIEDQIKEVQLLAERYNIKIVDIISESKSAKEPGRPLFNQMLQRIHKGEADGILTWKLNRLARNPIDGGQISWMLQQNIIKHIQTFERDYNPSDNVLLMQVEFGMANQYVKDLSIDVKRGMRQKAERGWYPIPVLPLGYIHNPRFDIGVDEEIIPDEKQFKILKKIWELFLTGKYTIASIKKRGDAIGLRTKSNRLPSKSTYHYILTNEFYSGFFYWKDKDENIARFKGKHKSIVTPQDFEKVQRILNGKPYNISRERKYNFPYRGLIKCGECKCNITPDHKLQAICTRCKYKFSIKSINICPKCKLSLTEMDNPTILDILYYHCTKSKGRCSQGSITKEMIDSSIEKSLHQISISKESYLWAIDRLKNFKKEKSEDEELMVELENKRKVLQERLEELVTLLADRKITSDQFNLTSLKTQKEISSIQFEIEETKTQQIDWVKQMESNLDFSSKALYRFKNGDNSIKTEILKEMSSNITLLNKKLYISIKNSFLDIYKKDS